MSTNQAWYLGLDLGTSSVGWAVTDEHYNIPRIKGKRAWGVRLFSEAQTAAERRSFRTARRRLARRKQRIALLDELLRTELEAVDSAFLDRLRDSALVPADKRGANRGQKHSLFNDDDYTDRDYYRDFPTIWHLRQYPIKPDGSKHVDVRHYYLAIHHVLKHRGHFLYPGNFELGSSFNTLYADLLAQADQYGIYFSDDPEHSHDFQEAIKLRGVIATHTALKDLLQLDRMLAVEDAPEDIQKRGEALTRLIAGGKAKLNVIFGIDEELSYTFKQPYDEKRPDILDVVGEDNIGLLDTAKQLYDWALLDEVLQGHPSLSHSFVQRYERGRREGYGLVERGDREKAAPSGTKHGTAGFIDRRQLKGLYGGVIPHQVHRQELEQIVRSLRANVPSVSEETAARIVSLLTFRIPYYVGPLRAGDSADSHAWIVRTPGNETTPIRPWNFAEVVDEAASADAFIQRMLNDCTYLAGETCLPKAAMLWQEFLILNDLNNLTINGAKLDPATKQQAFRDLFIASKRKVTEKRFREWLVSNSLGDASTTLAGVEFPLKHTMASYHSLVKVFSERGEDWVLLNRATLDAAIRIITVMPASSDREGAMLRSQLAQHLDRLELSDDELDRLVKQSFGSSAI